MIAGQSLSEQYIIKTLNEGNVTVTLHDAFIRFGTNFVVVHPIPSRCKNSFMDLFAQSNMVPGDTCYVAKPGSSLNVA